MKRRQVNIAPSAVQRIQDSCLTEEELGGLVEGLAELGRNPETGTRLTENPGFLVIEIGKYTVHYVFDDETVYVAWIGVY